MAVNALGSIQDLGVKIMVKQDGGDPDSVQFLTIPYADMIAALKAGRVDAVALSEPFSTAAREQNLKALFSYVTSPTPGAPVGAFFTSEKTLSTRGDDVETFVKGIEKATKDANDNPDAVKKALAGYTKIPTDVLDKIHTFPFSTDISEQQISDLSKVLVEYGYMDKEVAAKDILK